MRFIIREVRGVAIKGFVIKEIDLGEEMNIVGFTTRAAWVRNRLNIFSVMKGGIKMK